MKPFFWKIAICLIPNLLAGWAVWHATSLYTAGEGGFKLGVDLVGGTILVYEIDTSKQKMTTPGGDQKDSKLLAAYLKRRIDPNDLYNIVIRMVGDNRVEIILPTGGKHRSELAQQAWFKVLNDVKGEYPALKDQPKVFDVGQGKVEELAERIKKALEEKKWPALLSGKENWDKLVNIALDWQKDRKQKEEQFKKIPPGQYPRLIAEVKDYRKAVEDIQSTARTEAWKETLKRLQAWLKKDYPKLGTLKLDASEFFPNKRDKLISYIQGRGNPFTETALQATEPVMGEYQLPDTPSPEEIRKRVDDLYGPSTEVVVASIDKYYKASERRDVTSEEVQRIKDLIARVGKLEFLILANNVDDKDNCLDSPNGVDDAREYLKQLKPEELDRFQKQGIAPPTPMVGKTLKTYRIRTAKGESTVSYRWVEMGPAYRRTLGLSNQFAGQQIWEMVAQARQNKAVAEIPDSRAERSNGKLYVYSWETKNQNMTEEKRKEKRFDYFILARNPEIDEQGAYVGRGQPMAVTGDYLTRAYAATGRDLKPAVNFQFDSTGASLFGRLTGQNVPSEEKGSSSTFYRHLAIVLDDQVMSAPTINSVIQESGEITGDFTSEEVSRLVNILRSGALPATLKPQPVSENTMGATLGEDTIESGVTAVGIAFAAVLLFMVVYYRFAGLVACVALLSNLLLTVGFMVAVQATFTLPGLAGLVLMLGMAVDANVLIYERLREERDRGASLALAIRNGYDRAFPTIIDTHLSSIFTAIVLYVVGNDQLKGFGVSLTVGLIISLFTSLYMTRLLFDIWQHKGWLKKLSMFRLLSKTNIDFMAIRYYWFTATIVLTVLGATAFVLRGKQGLNIDFVGGTAYGGKLEKAMDLQQLRALFDDKRQAEMLKVDSVKQDTAGKDADHWYTITYARPLAGGEKENSRRLYFTNVPAGDTRAAREADVKKRAEYVPDWSVEQVFVSSAQGTSSDKSKYFTVRTVEKEPKLVQASLDRLLQEKEGGTWQPLLEKVRLDYKVTSKPGQKLATEAKLTFSDFASPSFVSTLLNENLAAENRPSNEGYAPGLDVPFTVTGEGQSKESHYKVMDLTLTGGGMEPRRFAEALEKTKIEFNQRPQPERLENFDSALAAETRGRAILAIVLSWGALLLYLWFRFGNWTFGLAAVLCLIHDLFFTLGMIAFASFIHATAVGQFLLFEDFKLDLTAVAALLTLVGYSVSDTIVVFDRIREVRGKNPELTPQTINDSVNQTLSRTLLTAFSVFLVVIVLYIWGGPGVHLFAFVMVVGVVVGTYSSIYIASPLLLIFGEGARGAARARERQPKPVPAPVS